MTEPIDIDALNALKQRGSRITAIRMDEPRAVSGRSMFVQVSFPDDARFKAIATGGAAEVPYQAVLHDDEIRVTLTMDVVDGSFTCTRYAVEQLDGVGLERRTTDIGRGLHLRELMASVVSVVPPKGSDYDVAQAIVEAAGHSLRRNTKPIPDDQLAEIAEAYRARPRRETMFLFAERFNYSERQMRRLLNRAVERGFLAEGERR